MGQALDIRNDGLRIVLVEGNATDARRLTLLFEQRQHPHFAVELAENFADGTRMIFRTHPDLVLLDLDLPDGRGLEVLHRLREAHADVPVVVLTAQDTQATGIAAVSEGALDYLNKATVDEELLARTVQTAISREKLLQQHREDVVRLARGERAESVGRMTVGLVHDFNNMLMVIQSNAALLRNALDNHEPTNGRVEAIGLAVQQGAAVCRQLLSFCKGSANQAVVLELGALVAGMLPLLKQVGGPRTSVEHIRGEGPVYVCADGAQLEQVVMNLVLNAKDSVGADGHIVIETRGIGRDQAALERNVSLPKGTFGALFVSDDGCGMDAATQARIFEDFFSTKAQGTGLGLPIVFGAVHGAGGAIAVDSAPGQGSCFRIYLPTSPAMVRSAEATHS
jgi:two-component system cell cycle sensor histidine kinase/response regulator CckA